MINGEDVKSNITKNIIKYREKAGLSQKELAKKLNVSPSRISNWEQGSNCPNIEILFEVCKVLNVSINDIYGVYPDSEMTLSYNEQEYIKKYRFISTHSPDGASVVDMVLAREYSIAEQLEKKDERIIDLEERLVPRRIFAYHGKIASAGTSYGFDDIASGTIEVPLEKAHENADYTIGVSGDSMEPTYYDGDIVYVQKATHLNVGDVGIFQKDNCIYIKEVGENGLISHNSKYKPMTDGGDVVCLGKVLGKVEG